MRLAPFLRHRPRLLMQLDLTRTVYASSPLKRPSDQAAFATAATKFARTAKIDHKHHVEPRLVSPSFDFQEMPQSRSKVSNQSSSQQPKQKQKQKQKEKDRSNKPVIVTNVSKRDVLLVHDVQDRAALDKKYSDILPTIEPKHVADPMSIPNNISINLTGLPMNYRVTRIRDRQSHRAKMKDLFRSEASIPTDPPVIGVGDGPSETEARKVATLALLCELQQRKMLYPSKADKKSTELKVTLTDGASIEYEEARNFMDYYCHRYHFAPPEMTYTNVGSDWETVMAVDGRKIGMGIATSKKLSMQRCYLDVVQYLERCDPELWKDFKNRAAIGHIQRVTLHLTHDLKSRVRDLIVDLRSSDLYKNRPALAQGTITDTSNEMGTRYRVPNRFVLAEKSRELSQRQKQYNEDPLLERMRTTRAALPVYSRSNEILSAIETNDVTILMAATGSGKTTQVPQLLLDSFIEKGSGAECNILCTQPRRLAALSVAHRVANERGEQLGRSVGYVVRFEAKPPEPNGSINFCTIGIFLKMLQTALTEGRGELDSVTHIVVDEVHERDVDTDLLLVVLKRLMDDRKARNKPLKIILMSATIDPTLFQNYFPDDRNMPAPVVEVPGRTFPVQRHYLEDFFRRVSSGPMEWIFNEDSVVKYAIRELGVQALPPSVSTQKFDLARINTESESDIEIPYSLIAATIAHVLEKSDSGHVLTFLAGWDDISAVQKILLNPPGPLPIDFNSPKYSIHLLHSSVPLAEQQVIFDPPPEGVRRIILATNIAETSVTIPDVVYVVDSARLKEQRFDPEKHISSLVSAWVGSSNLNQRAGRAGRHRPGEYYGVLSRKHAESLQPYQTVEMSRVDLSNVVMHIKALNFPGMSVEEVLEATIEPPQSERVAAAMKTLQMVGAIDDHKNLTSLGRVLLQIPVDVQVGRLVLLGSFFRCLDQALTLAALLTNRDPFLSPMHMKEAAAAAKNKWCPPGIKSDPLTALRAFNAWDELQSQRQYQSANRFTVENFLSKPTLLLIQKLKTHLLQSLYSAGVIDISAGGGLGDRSRYEIPPELNQNGDSMSLLASLISISCQPKFAVRASEKIWRTQTERATMIHPSSVNHPKHLEGIQDFSRQIVAFVEKRRNVSAGNTSSTFLVGTTRVEPLLFVLFGAHRVEKDEQGLMLDGWINLIGNLDTLDDVYDVRKYLDSCMSRVFEGIVMGRRKHRNLKVLPREEDAVLESGDDEMDANRDYSLSPTEVKELDLLSRDVVNILNQYSSERGVDSVPGTRAGTPSTRFGTSRFSGGYPGSGYNTPFGHSHSPFNSRASTPTGRPWRRLQ
ncbi:hypothetical protein FB446DRAFT_711436 [Lentinula raphanica]|nr:hypothetical protein FB446DRAFT_711436 [Lentinula raphanica]